MTIGTLVAFNRYLILMNEPVRWLGFVVNRIARAIASGERHLRDARHQGRPSPSGRGRLDLRPLRGEVQFADVTFAFRRHPAQRAERASRSTARPGEVIALVGPTGAGKSAIINLIPRFYDVRAAGC